MARKASIAVAVLFLILTACGSVSASHADKTVSRIDKLASQGEGADSSLVKSVMEEIGKDPAGVSSVLVSKLEDKNLTEQQAASYIWALGQTKDPHAIDAIINTYKKTKFPVVKENCIIALSMIGGSRSGEFILSVMDSSADAETQFRMLNILAEMQYEPALPRTMEILKLDYRKYYWQSVFIFGKMGDKSVPFLLGKIDDKDVNVRANAMNMLGQWLIPVEASKPLFERYWVEKNTDLRSMIQSSLEITTPDLSLMKQYFDKIVSGEKNDALLKSAKKTLESMDSRKEMVVRYEKSKKVSEGTFDGEYSRLMMSAGNEGDYDVLAVSSTIKDEPKLKGLRERILQRSSDEAFNDYMKVDRIIMMNRLAKTGAVSDKGK